MTTAGRVPRSKNFFMSDSALDNNQEKRFSAAFIDGLTAPSKLALGVAIAIVLLNLLAFVSLPESLLKGEQYRYFMAHELDTQTLLTHRLLNIEDSTEPFVAIMGTSVMVRCIEDHGGMEREIGKHTQVTPRFYNLTADDQKSWEIASILSLLPQKANGVIVLGLSPGLLDTDLDSLRKSVEQSKIGVFTKALDEEATRAGITPPPRRGIYSLDNSHYLLSHRHALLLNLLRGGLDYSEPLEAWWMDTVNNPEFREKEKSQLPEKRKEFEDNVNYNLEVIDRAISRLESTNHYSILIAIPPINPGWYDVPGGKAFFDEFRSILQAFADARGFKLISVSEPAALTQADFVDYEGHMNNPAARSRCNNYLAKTIATSLQEQAEQ